MAEENMLPPVVAVLMADIVDLKAKLAEAKGEMEATAKKSDSTLGNIGKKAAVAFAAGGAAVAAFGALSIHTFSDVAGDTLKMTRITGESAETMSRLRFAGEETGVSAEQMSKGFVKLSKDVEGHNKVLAQYGIATTDAAGKQLSTNDVLMNTADVFARMPDGMDKTALAVKLFGRSGADMLPFLNKGKAGLEDLTKESDKFGLTIGQKNVDDYQKNLIAGRQMHAAWQGLQVMIGEHLMPILAKVTTFIAEHMPAALAWVRQEIEKLQPWFVRLGNVVEVAGRVLQDVIGWLLDHKAVLAAVGVAIGTVLVAAFVAWAAAAAAAAAAQLAALAPIAAVVAAIAALGVGIYELVTHWHQVVKAVEDFIKRLPELAAKFWGWIKDAVPKAIAELGRFLVTIGDWVLHTALPAIGAKLLEWGKAFAAWVGPAALKLLEELGKLYIQLEAWIWTVALPKIVAKLLDWALAFVEWVPQAALDLIGALGGLILKMTDWILTTALPAIVSKLLEWGLAFAKWVPGAILSLIIELGKLYIRLEAWIWTEALPKIVSKLLEWGLAFAKWVPQAALDLIGALGGLILNVISWIGDQASAIALKVYSWGTALFSWVVDFVRDIPNRLSSIGDSIGSWITGLIGDMARKFTGIAQAIGSGLLSVIKQAWNVVADWWNSNIGGVGFTVPSWIPGIGGASIRAPSLPRAALGGQVTESGLTVVGEKGAEIVRLPKGAEVYPHGSVPAGMGGSMVVNQYFNGITDIGKLSRAAARELSWARKVAA